MSAGVSPLLYFGPGRGADKDSWGTAVFVSVAAHAALLALFMFSGTKKAPPPVTVLTQVNFVEKPVEVPAAPTGGAPEASRGALDVTPQSPTAQPSASQVVAFSGPSQGAPMAQAVNAPIIPNAPIMPVGEVGAIGSKKAALAPLPFQAPQANVKKGAVPMPVPGTQAGKPLAMNTQGVEDIKKGGAGGPVAFLTQAAGSGGPGGVGGPLGGKPVAGGGPGGGTINPPKRAPIETLKAGAISKETWGQKTNPFSMEGPLKYRKIKAMQMPPYPRWAEEQGVEAVVSYRLWVDPKGKVIADKMYLEKTSGFSELDQLAKEALLKFVFVPLPDGAEAEDEWGVATFRFELKK